MASYYPDTPDLTAQQAAVNIMQGLSRLYPCSYCAKHLAGELKSKPPQVQSRQALEQWMCELHNEVNERLGKPVFDCARVRERWRDGPADGSCG
jgi:FAD-linked sulfhydryl oxidase